jgi:hypothetical protein
MRKNCNVVLLILIISAIICIAVLNTDHRKTMRGGGINDGYVFQNGRIVHNAQNTRNAQIAQNTMKVSQPKLPIYWGNGIPLEYEMRYTADVSPEEKIYTISGNNNEVGPQCCPSAYSTSSGCICPLLH